MDEGEKLCVVIALGYGENQGEERKSKTIVKYHFEIGAGKDHFMWA